MHKRQLFLLTCSLFFFGQVGCFADETAAAEPQQTAPKFFSAFTGKILKDKVRMRTQPNLDGQIIREMSKDDMIIVLGETDEFYIVEAPTDLKAYVFRTFVLDNKIEGNHVNVRSLPDLEAPIIAQLNTGDSIEGMISSQNGKWFEISTPTSARFYICKDYIEKLGDASLMATLAKRKDDCLQLLQSTKRLSSEEMQKPFPEINLDRLTKSYQTLINDYSDFAEQTNQARELLTQLNEDYLNKKIAYLEYKAFEKVGSFDLKKSLLTGVESKPSEHELPGRMSLWMPQEQSLFESWNGKEGEVIASIDDFYDKQKAEAITLHGLLETYKRPVKNRPGDYLLINKSSNLPIAYLYSTKVDLENIVGQEVNIIAVERPNNHFAYPAYFVLAIE